MAEHSGGPVWDRPDGSGEPLYDLAGLGVPEELIERLHAWNGRYEAVALTGFEWDSPQAMTDWQRRGRELALALQDVLQDVEVWYWEGPERAVPVQGGGSVSSGEAPRSPRAVDL